MGGNVFSKSMKHENKIYGERFKCFMTSDRVLFVLRIFGEFFAEVLVEPSQFFDL
jgi:hypothetical protein